MRVGGLFLRLEKRKCWGHSHYGGLTTICMVHLILRAPLNATLIVGSSCSSPVVAASENATSLSTIPLLRENVLPSKFSHDFVDQMIETKITLLFFV